MMSKHYIRAPNRATARVHPAAERRATLADAATIAARLCKLNNS
jgi:hypothetical protein